MWGNVSRYFQLWIDIFLVPRIYCRNRYMLAYFLRSPCQNRTGITNLQGLGITIMQRGRTGRQRGWVVVGGVAASPSTPPKIRTWNLRFNRALQLPIVLVGYLFSCIGYALDWDFSFIYSLSSIISYAQLYNASSCFVK